MNYILEGDGDFNTLLMKALCTDEKEDDTLCLISTKPLEKNHITLICNHKFNYKPLFTEVLKQKKTFNRLETQKLKKNQMKCPYCRNIQDGILPYQPSQQRVWTVNWPPKYAMFPHKCKALFKSGKRKGLKCNKPSLYEFCPIHIKTNTIAPNNFTLHNNIITCNAVIKSGKNKGKKCTYKAKFEGLCGCHKS